MGRGCVGQALVVGVGEKLGRMSPRQPDGPQSASGGRELGAECIRMHHRTERPQPRGTARHLPGPVGTAKYCDRP